MADPTRILFGKELIKYADKYNFSVFNTDTKGCGLDEFGKLFPERYHQFGICEQCMFAAASGYASCGEKVIVPSIGVFASMRASEQIRTFICYPKLNVTIMSTHGGLLTGGDGATHCTVEDLGIMRSIPNMTIIEPSDKKSALTAVEPVLQFDGPLYIRFPKTATPDINTEEYSFKIGKGNIILEYGNDIAIIAIGWILSKAVEAAEYLKKIGIKATVIEIHTLKPIDEKLITDIAKRCGKIITVEDHNIMCGLGSAVSEVVSESYPVIIKRIGIRDTFGESGNPDKLYEKHKMTTNDIVETAKLLVKGN